MPNPSDMGVWGHESRLGHGRGLDYERLTNYGTRRCVVAGFPLYTKKRTDENRRPCARCGYFNPHTSRHDTQGLKLFCVFSTQTP